MFFALPRRVSQLRLEKKQSRFPARWRKVSDNCTPNLQVDLHFEDEALYEDEREDLDDDIDEPIDY